MKFIMSLLFFCSLTNLFSYSDDYIEFNSEEVYVKYKYHEVKTDNEEYYLTLTYLMNFNGQDSTMEIVYRLPKDFDFEILKKSIHSKKITFDSQPYGMGKILDYAKERGFTALNDKTKRYAQNWSSFNTSDILLYVVSDEDFEYLIQLVNVWPKSIEMPPFFSNKDIDNSFQEESDLSYAYKFWDSFIINNLVFRYPINTSTK